MNKLKESFSFSSIRNPKLTLINKIMSKIFFMPERSFNTSSLTIKNSCEFLTAKIPKGYFMVKSRFYTLILKFSYIKLDLVGKIQLIQFKIKKILHKKHSFFIVIAKPNLKSKIFIKDI